MGAVSGGDKGQSTGAIRGNKGWSMGAMIRGGQWGR